MKVHLVPYPDPYPFHTRSIPESCQVRIILLRPLIFNIQFLSTLISLNTFDLLQPCHASEVYGGLYQDRLFQHILRWSINIIDLESPYEEVWIKSLGDNSLFHTCGSPRTDPYPFLEPYPYIHITRTDRWINPWLNPLALEELRVNEPWRTRRNRTSTPRRSRWPWQMLGEEKKQTHFCQEFRGNTSLKHPIYIYI